MAYLDVRQVRNTQHVQRVHLLKLLKLFLVTFWLFHAFALYVDTASAEAKGPHAEEWPERSDLNGAINAIIFSIYFSMTALGLVLVWFETFALTASLAAFWTILFVFDVASNLDPKNIVPSLAQYHYLANLPLIGLLWYYSALIKKELPWRCRKESQCEPFVIKFIEPDL